LLRDLCPWLYGSVSCLRFDLIDSRFGNCLLIFRIMSHFFNGYVLDVLPNFGIRS